MSTTDRFPTARHIKVDELVKLYDGILPQLDAALAEKSISVQTAAPSVPQDLDGIVRWGENNDPIIPDDLTILDLPLVGKLFSLISNWTNYLSGEITRADVQLLVQERHVKVIEYALSAYYRDEENVKTTLVAERVALDTRFIELDSQVLSLKAFVMVARARHEQLKRSLNLISREQTRRQDEFERELNERNRGNPTPITPAWGRGRRPESQ